MNIGACIVDTNVPIVANGTNEAVCFECRFRTVEFLEKMMNSGILIVDLNGEVETEYWRNLRTDYPGVGNRFIQHFLTANANRVQRVELTPTKNGFEELEFAGPLKNFDLSDRKFAALSKATGRPVYVSVDSDWAISRDGLQKAGVTINFLCGDNQHDWFL